MSTKQLISIENYIENPKETSLINSPRSLYSMINLILTIQMIIILIFLCLNFIFMKMEQLKIYISL